MDLFEQAEAAEEIGQLQNALELWESICRTDPDPPNLCKLGRLRQKLGKWQPAEEALLAALAIDRSFTIAMLFLGILNMHREDIEQEAAMQQATTWLEKAIALEPSAMAYTFLGVTFCHRKDPKSARHASNVPLKSTRPTKRHTTTSRACLIPATDENVNCTKKQSS